MTNVLVVSGHTDLNDSVANKKILKEIEKSLPEAEIDYLSKLYPDYKIDKEAEQEKLVKADIIVLQYPIFWYGIPSLLKKWMEVTFEHGFSHGSSGDKLKGKKLIASFTSGAPEEIYHKNELVGYEIEDFFPSIKATCALCQIDFEGFVYTGGVAYAIRETESDEIIRKATEHSKRLIELINSL